MASARLLYGWRARLVRLGILGNVLTLAMRTYGNPITAVRALKLVIAKKRANIGSERFIKMLRAGGKYHWAIASPGWPSIAFSRFILNELNQVQPYQGGSHRLHTAIFSITSLCPLRCGHCYEWDNLSQTETLGFDQLRAILWKLQRLGVGSIEFSGGEPLSRYEDLLRLLKVARPGTDFWILTSGIGLTRERADQLKEAGLDGVAVSLDHWDEGEHNRFRGSNASYGWALEAARNAAGAGLATAFSLCAQKEFVSQDNLLRYLWLAADNRAGFVRILEPRQTGHFRGREIELEEEQINCLREFYLFTKTDPSCRRLPGVEYTGYHQRLRGCFGAGVRYLYIDSRGDVHACPFCQNPVGNAPADSLQECRDKLQAIGCHKFALQAAESSL